MARNKKIEAILAALYHRDRGPLNQRAKAEATLNRLLDDIRANTPFTRDEVKEHLHGHYIEYKRTRAANEKLEDRNAPE